ncbi:MAG: hypothetical protein UZ07_CHB004000055 [Chlorobi bacterium OLB7]|nr:MAG: hypothetical protein UZ07_CHB004000055 [Chlorobi bacterium OLB7]
MRPIRCWHHRAVLWLLLCLGWCVAPASGQSKLVVRKMANFTLLVPSNQDPTQLTGLLESARKRVQEYGLALPRAVVVRIYSTSVQFAQATGLTTGTISAGERNGRLHLQPLPLLLPPALEASRTLQRWNLFTLRWRKPPATDCRGGSTRGWQWWWPGKSSRRA